MSPIRFRQVHLDFHTSEAIPSVGEKFSPQQFQEALKRGSVGSITIFSKCHHGLSYHSTKVGQRHPGLHFDLLPRQIEACRAIDVKCPIYISVGLDEWSARHHPEWIIQNQDGCGPNPLSPQWKGLGFDTPYLDYLCAQIEEVVDTLDAADGFFLDIVNANRNFSQLGLAAMRAAGVNPKDADEVTAWSHQVLQNYFARTTAACKKGNPERKVFHNSGHVPKGATAFLKWNSHLELESLPTGGWGYDHFPISASYASTTGYGYLGMTGKFHTTWGEFGGFKRPEALQYECAAILAYGARCIIGDQLHPSGEMSPDTYELVGAAYREVAAVESWCEGASPVSEIAVLSPEALHSKFFGGHGQDHTAEEGVCRMLLELGAQFDVIDLDHDLAPYRLLILPDEIALEGEFLAKVQGFLAGGGRLILSGASGLTPDQSAFALDLGLTLLGRSPFDPDFIVPTAATPTPPVRGPFVVHGGAFNATAGEGWEVLAGRRDPYFNREWDHFCSHQNTPDAVDSPYPAVLCNGQVAWFAHALFSSYRNLGQPLYRDLFQDVLQRLVPDQLVETTLPSAGRARLTQQPATGEHGLRSVLHLLFTVPQKRGANAHHKAGQQAVEIIEGVFPVHDVECRVRAKHRVSQVRLVPSGEVLPFRVEGEAVRFTVPVLRSSQLVELS